MILPYDANPGRMEFSERTAISTAMLRPPLSSTGIIAALADLSDKTNEQRRYTAATYLLNHDIDVLIDDSPSTFNARTSYCRSIRFQIDAIK